MYGMIFVSMRVEAHVSESFWLLSLVLHFPLESSKNDMRRG